MRTITVAALMAMPAGADVLAETTPAETGAATDTAGEFLSEEHLEEGFLTHYVNKAVENGMADIDKAAENEYGRKVTGYVSAPKFGGYFIGKYSYSNLKGAHSGDGFSQRLIRLYVDGTILKDFAYRIQVQTNNTSFHMKDFYVEWQKYKTFRVKIGQYKRAFGFENPMNPWDVGVGDYSQLTKKLTGHSDYIGAETSSNGGRDQGLQVQGDLLPIGKDRHCLLHYQLMVANGQGINSADADSRKDLLGTVQVQPVRGLFLGLFGWTGSYTANGVTVDRNRYMLSAKYDRDDWTLMAEYAHSAGHKVSDYVKAADGTYSVSGSGEADAWYVTVGVPCTDWLKTYVKYDAYRDDATWGTAKSIYSVCPNFQLHKNLMFQLQYNYVHDRTLDKSDYSEVWLETYVRF